MCKAASYLPFYCSQRPFSLSRQVNRGGKREVCKPRSTLFSDSFFYLWVFIPEYHKPSRIVFFFVSVFFLESLFNTLFNGRTHKPKDHPCQSFLFGKLIQHSFQWTNAQTKRSSMPEFSFWKAYLTLFSMGERTNQKIIHARVFFWLLFFFKRKVTRVPRVLSCRSRFPARRGRQSSRRRRPAHRHRLR